MPVKVIAYLVIGVFSVLVAVVVFVKIWNTFIGQDTVSADVKSLADIINNMLKDERHYIQQPFVLQLQDKSLIGFDKGQNELVFKRMVPDISVGYNANSGPPPMKEEEKKFTASKECNKHACLCTAKADTVEECFPVDSTERHVEFAIHAPGLETSQPVSKEMYFPSGNLDTIDDGAYYQLWFSTDSFIYTRNAFGKLTEEQRSKAILPILVEKISDPSSINTWIIISPNTPEERAKYFYLEQCTVEGEKSCEGLTPYSSFASMKPQYCSLQNDDGKCVKNSLPACPNKESITSPCLCGTEPVLYGFCIYNNFYPGSCDFVEECKDYCSQDSSEKCSYKEKQLCTQNACDTISNCKFEGDVPSGSCVNDVAQPLTQCVEGVEITSPCLCGTTQADKGYCILGYLHNVDCSAINSCPDYCLNPDGSACSPSQIQECQLDICNRDCATTQDPNNYNYACVSEQSFDVDCSSGRVQTCQDYCNLLSYTAGDLLGTGAKGTCYNKEIDMCEADNCKLGCSATTTRIDSGSEGTVANLFKLRPRREGICEPR